MSTNRPGQWLIALSLGVHGCTGFIASPVEGSRGEGGNGGEDENGGNGGEVGNGGNSGNGGNGAEAADVCQPNEAAPSSAPTRRLSAIEYQNTVSDLFRGLAVDSLSFPAPVRIDGFENQVNSLPATASLVEREEDVAIAIAQKAVATRTRWAPCSGAETPACLQAIVPQFLSRAFRRPPSPEEVTSARDLVTAAVAASDFPTALADLVHGVLLSPQFLYRLETPGDGVASGAAVPLDGYQMASRLSYLLWQTMPDQALFDAARSGSLTNPEELEATARRMLEDPRARTTVADFNRQWLQLDRFSSLSLSTDAYPEFNDELRSSYRASLAAFADGAFWKEDSYKSIFSSSRIYVSSSIAKLVDSPLRPTELTPVDVPARHGIFMQPAFLAMTSHGIDHSPVFRGIEVLRRFLCFDIPAAPANVPQLGATDPAAPRTTRERFEAHVANATCASCHKYIDGVGFTFENYDAVGRYVTEDNGFPINSAGQVPIGDTFQDVANASELTQVIGASDEARSCLSGWWYQYAFGHSAEKRSDACEVRNLANALARTDSPKDLLIALIRSTSFRQLPTTTLE